MSLRVSVAMCTYNGARFLKQQLESIRKQTVAVDELVVCDDGSQDETLSVLKQFKADASFPVNIIENGIPLGITRNFEKAAGACTGDLIFFSDQDDVWRADKVQTMKAFFSENPTAEAVFSDGLLIDENNDLMDGTLWKAYGFDADCQHHWKNGLALKDLLYNRNKVTGATLAITRKLYDRILPFEERAGWFHDQYIASHAAATNSLHWISAPLIRYRIHATQQVGLNRPVKSSISSDGHAYSLLDVLTYEAEESKLSLEKMRTFLHKYPKVNHQLIEEEMNSRAQFFLGRTHLSKNPLVRLGTVLGNFKQYQKFTPSGLRSMIRDVIRPAN